MDADSLTVKKKAIKVQYKSSTECIPVVTSTWSIMFAANMMANAMDAFDFSAHGLKERSEQSQLLVLRSPY